MDTNKKSMITFAIIASVLLIAGGFILWKYMELRKNVAKLATNTKTPTSSSTTAAIDAVNSQANSIV